MTESSMLIAHTIEEVPALLAVEGSAVLAGGTQIQAQNEPDTIKVRVDIRALEGLSYIRQRGRRIEIGPLTTHQQIVDSPLLRELAPSLVSACASVCDAHARECGTIGGNIATFSPAADTIPPLMAAKAKITLKTDSDFEELDLERFLKIRRGKPLGELITKISFPQPEGNWGAAFQKLGTRDSRSLSIASAAVQLTCDENQIITSVRAAIGSCASSVMRARTVERFLKGKQAADTILEQAADLVLRDIAPVEDGQCSAEERGRGAQQTVLQVLLICVSQTEAHRESLWENAI